MDFTLILLVPFNSNYWLDFILIFYITDSKFHIIYSVSFIYRIWVLVVIHSHPFKASLFLSKDNGIVAPSLSTIVFSVVFLDFLISHKVDHSFGSLLPLAILYRAFVFLPYIVRETRCPPPFLMWWWTMSGIGSPWRYMAKIRRLGK